MKVLKSFCILFFLFLVQCKTKYVATQHSQQLYKITNNTQSDTVSLIDNYLKPFRDSLNKTMNEVLGEAMGDFIKEKPSGSLGNLVADAMLNEARRSMYDVRTNKASEHQTSNIEHQLISGAITNPGGLRINQISKGKITKGKIFELLPFENELVIVEVNGKILKQWMELIKDNGGWPMTNNLISDTIEIDDHSYEPTYHVITKSFEDSLTYFIATNDYVANGGDNCSFLIPCKKYPTGKTIRDLVIEYIKAKQKIYPDNTKRIQF